MWFGMENNNESETFKVLKLYHKDFESGGFADMIGKSVLAGRKLGLKEKELKLKEMELEVRKLEAQAKLASSKSKK